MNTFKLRQLRRFFKFQGPKVPAKINVYKSKLAVAHPRSLTDKTSSSDRPSPFVIHYWRVCVGIFIVPRMLTGCTLWRAWIWILPRKGKASYVNADETNELPLPYSRFPRRVADDTPTMACHLLPVRAVYKRKKSRRAARQWFSLLVVEKARVSYHRQSVLCIPSEVGACCWGKKRRDAQVRRRPWMLHKAA